MSIVSRRGTLVIVSLLIAVVVVGLYFPTIMQLISVWNENGNSHGFVLAAIYLYAFGKLLIERAPRQPKISFVGLVGLVGVSIFWFLTRVALIEKLELIAFIFVPLMLVWALFGFKVAKWFVLPTLILVFATPIFELLHYQLQVLTAFGSEILLNLLGVTFFREGLMVYIPNGAFIIEKGCSGLGSLTMGVAIALIYAWINRLKLLGTAVSVLIIAFLAYLSNVVRVCIIIIIGSWYSMDHPLVTDHAWVGWVTFAVVIAAFLLVAQRFIKRSEYTLSTFIENAPVQTGSRQKTSYAVVSLVVAIATLALGPMIYQIQFANYESRSIIQHELPVSVDRWDRVSAGSANEGIWKPNYEAAGTRKFKHAFYQSDGETVSVFTMLFDHQTSGDEVINVSNRSYDSAASAKLYRRKVDLPGGEVLGQIYEEHLRIGGAKDILVWTVYKVQDRWIGTPSLVKLYNLYETLLGRPLVSVYIIGVDVTADDLSRARLVLEEFTTSLKSVVTIDSY